MNRLARTLLPLFLLTAAAQAQDKMEVKDADSNVLMKVEDEGSAGSLTIMGLGAAPTSFTNKLYNIGGALYWNGNLLSAGASPWATNGANIYFNSGNVGIGTASPLHLLHVGSAAHVGDQSIALQNDQYTWRHIVGSDGSYVLDGSVEGTVMLVTTDGKVGIGTKTPSTFLEVGGTVTANAFVGDGSGLTDITAPGDNLGDHTAAQALNLNGNWLSGDGDGEGVFVDANGNVGLGTSSPLHLLHVGSAAHIGDQSIALQNDQYTWRHIVGSDGSYVLDGSVEGTVMLVTTDGKVGIGTKTPSTFLEVGGTVTANAFVGDGSGLTGITAPGDNLGDHTAAQALNLNGNWLSGDGDGEGVFVDASGSVGLGTASPLHLLHVGSATHTGDQSIALQNDQYTWRHIVGSDGSYVLDGSVEGTVMLVTTDGKVGIGTKTPSTFLEVGGTVTANAFVGDGSGLTNLPSGSGWSLTGNASTVDGTNFIGTTDNVALDFRVNNVRGLRIQPTTGGPNLIGGFSGNSVGAGIQGATISGGGHSSGIQSVTDNFGTIGGGAKNTVSATSATVAGGENNTASGEGATVAGGVSNIASGAGAMVVGGEESQATGDYSFAAGAAARANHDGSFVWNGDQGFSAFSSTATEQFLINASNGVGINTNAPSEALHVNGNALADAHTTPSSRRWKTNIQTIDNALETVQKLRGVTYDWKETGKHDIGLVAEEVGAVIPEIVEYEENGVDAKSVDYPRLVAVLIEAVKDLKQENDALKSQKTDRDVEITKLKSQNSAFEKRFAQIELALRQMKAEDSNPDASGQITSSK